MLNFYCYVDYFLVSVLFLFWFVQILAFFAVLTTNLYYSVITLLVLYFLSGCLMIISGAEYLGLLFIIIYVGAIAILFLFVIMFFDYSILVTEAKNTSFLAGFLALTYIVVELFLYNGYLLPQSVLLQYGVAVMADADLAAYVIFREPFVYLGIFMFNFYTIQIAVSAFILFLILAAMVFLLQPIHEKSVDTFGLSIVTAEDNNIGIDIKLQAKYPIGLVG